MATMERGKRVMSSVVLANMVQEKVGQDMTDDGREGVQKERIRMIKGLRWNGEQEDQCSERLCFTSIIQASIYPD
jgi:hypothetical protein